VPARMTMYDRAAQQYFDPPDPEPRCDRCDERAETPHKIWGEFVCEECYQQHLEDLAAEEDDGEEFLRKMEQAADEAAAGLPFGGSE
jgi:hypothetical protein